MDDNLGNKIFLICAGSMPTPLGGIKLPFEVIVRSYNLDDALIKFRHKYPLAEVVSISEVSTPSDIIQ